jgi:hypothetical protein
MTRENTPSVARGRNMIRALKATEALCGVEEEYTRTLHYG